MSSNKEEMVATAVTTSSDMWCQSSGATILPLATATTIAIENISNFVTASPSTTTAIKITTPNWNCRSSAIYNPYTISFKQKPEIVNINIIVPNKVVEVTIYDGKEHKYKQVCRKPDVFDLRFALALAMVKYKDEIGQYEYHLTLEGIEEMADRFLRYYKEFAKEIDRAIKAYNKWFKEKTKQEVEEAERLAIIERRRAKNKKRKEKMRAKKKADEIETIVEAIKKSKEDK